MNEKAEMVLMRGLVRPWVTPTNFGFREKEPEKCQLVGTEQVLREYLLDKLGLA